MKSRNPAFDALRILASFSVVMLHSAAHLWYYLPINTRGWFYVNTYDALFRFGVPIFVMLSGALFLQPGREINLRRLYCHNILRLFVIYLVWCILYGIYAIQNSQTDIMQWKQLIKTILTAPYHLWFLPMLIGIYMISPLIKRWTDNAPQREIEYFLLLFLIFQIGITTLSCFIKSSFFTNYLSAFQPELAASYVGYFVLGYYLTTFEFPPIFDRVLFALLPVSAVGNVVISSLLSIRAGQALGVFFDSFGIFTFLISAGLFRLSMKLFSAKYQNCRKHDLSARLLTGLAQDTLGIYLIHLFVMEMPFSMNLFFHLPAFISIPLISMISFCISLVITAVLRRIPLIGKYIC